MPQTLIVLIHGGQHTGACWDPTVAALARLAPEVPVLAVNLPGHGDAPGDLASLTIGQCVQGVLDQIQASGVEAVVLVGHSMAGITLPGVAARLGAARLRGLVYVACCIPPQGQAVLDTLELPMSLVASLASRWTRVLPPLPAPFARWVFGNGMDRAQRRQMVRSLCAESTRITTEGVDRSNYPSVPTTWVLPLGDRAVRPALQRRFMANLGRVDRVVELDTCHDAMITEPLALARIILAYCGPGLADRP